MSRAAAADAAARHAMISLSRVLLFPLFVILLEILGYCSSWQPYYKFTAKGPMGFRISMLLESNISTELVRLRFFFIPYKLQIFPARTSNFSTGSFSPSSAVPSFTSLARFALVSAEVEHWQWMKKARRMGNGQGKAENRYLWKSEISNAAPSKSDGEGWGSSYAYALVFYYSGNVQFFSSTFFLSSYFRVAELLLLNSCISSSFIIYPLCPVGHQ